MFQNDSYTVQVDFIFLGAHQDLYTLIKNVYLSDIQAKECWFYLFILLDFM